MIRNPRAGARKSGGFRLEVFTDDELREIHGATLEVLSRTGVFVEDEEARGIFAGAGAEVDAETHVVRLPAHLVEDAVRSAPSKVVMCGRDPARDVVLEDGRVGFTNFGEGIQVVDPYTGELHESRKQDVADCTKIIDALPEIDVLERPLGAHDVPPDTASLHNAEAIFSNTTKHATIGPLSGFCARKMIDMAAAIVGGRDELRRRPILSFLTCPVSPLKLVKDACEIIIEGARAGDDSRELRRHRLRQRFRLVRLEQAPCLGQRAVVQARRPGGGPVLPDPPVDELRLRLAAHALVRVVVAEEVLEGTDLGDDVHRQRLVGHRDPRHAVLDHARELGVHDELRVIDGDARLQHPQPVDQVGPCQRRQQAGDRLLMAGLGVRHFGIALRTRHPAGQQVEAREAGDPGADHRALGAAHRGAGEAQVHGGR